MRKLAFVASVVALGAVLAVSACGGDQQVVMPDASVASGDGGSGKTVKVTYGGSSKDVALGGMATVTVGTTPYVRLSEVVAAALPGKALAQLQASDFVASDGVSSSSKSNCTGILPLAGALLAQGYIDPATRNLNWDESLAYPGCMHLTDAAEIVLADVSTSAPDASVAGPDASTAGPDAGLAGKSVKVTYGGASTDVSIDQAASGASAATLSSVVAIAVPGKTADQLNLTDIVASDGYSPTQSGNCGGRFPLDGADLPKGFIECATRNVSWDSSLSFPGCMSVDDVAELQVADK